VAPPVRSFCQGPCRTEHRAEGIAGKASRFSLTVEAALARQSRVKAPTTVGVSVDGQRDNGAPALRVLDVESMIAGCLGGVRLHCGLSWQASG
jgi:hypothetical protein